MRGPPESPLQAPTFPFGPEPDVQTKKNLTQTSFQSILTCELTCAVLNDSWEANTTSQVGNNADFDVTEER